MRKNFKRALAAVLAVVMTLGIAPIEILAEILPPEQTAPIEIVGFEEPAEYIARQELPFGAEITQVYLPLTLEANVRIGEETPAPPFVVEVENDSEQDGENEEDDDVGATAPGRPDEPEGQTEPADSVIPAKAGIPCDYEGIPGQARNDEEDEGIPGQARNDEEDEGIPGQARNDDVYATIHVPVIWRATPEFDGEVAGEYVFTAELWATEGGRPYVLAEGVNPPQITATVLPPAFAPMAAGDAETIDIGNLTDGDSGENWEFNNGVLTLRDGAIIDMFGTNMFTIEPLDIEIVVEATATINVSGPLLVEGDDASPLSLNPGAELHLYIPEFDPETMERGSATFVSEAHAGIYVSEDAVLNIAGLGILTASSFMGDYSIYASQGHVNISGTRVIAVSPMGMGDGINGSFSMYDNAVVLTSSVSDTTPKESGLLIIMDIDMTAGSISSGATVHGDFTMREFVGVGGGIMPGFDINELEIPDGSTLTIPDGVNLRIIGGPTVNNGTIVIEDGGGLELIGGEFQNNGEIYGEYTHIEGQGQVINLATAQVVTTIEAGADVIITGSGGLNPRRIVVQGDSDITLFNVEITNPGLNQSPLDLEPGAEVNLTIVGENTLTGHGSGAGISATGASLTIDTIPGTSGSLHVNAGEGGGAAIGGNYTEDGGDIIINGGFIWAFGGISGGDDGGQSGTFTMTGGFVITTFLQDDNTDTRTGGILIIGDYTYWLGGQTEFVLENNAENPWELEIPAGHIFAIPYGITLQNFGTIVNNGAIIVDYGGLLLNFGTITGDGEIQGDIENLIAMEHLHFDQNGPGWSFNYSNNLLIIYEDANVIITGVSDGVRIRVEGDANITLRDLTVFGVGTDHYALMLDWGAIVNLHLQGHNILEGNGTGAGIRTADAVLYIHGPGSLEVHGGADGGVGIGGNDGENGGDITIHDGAKIGPVVGGIGGPEPGGGIRFEGWSVIVGDVQLQQDAIVEDGAEPDIAEYATLTIPAGVTLANFGTILVFGELVIEGYLEGDGQIIRNPVEVEVFDPIHNVTFTIFARRVEGDTTELTNGWWVVVDGDLTSHPRMTATGDNVNLILADGAMLVGDGITVAEDNSLTIWAQTEEAVDIGILVAVGLNGNAGIGGESGQASGTITINGGDVSVGGYGGGAAIGGGLGGNSGNIVINGGTILIEGHDGDVNIGGEGGTITIGGNTLIWTADGSRAVLGSVTFNGTPTIGGVMVLGQEAIVADGATLTIHADGVLRIPAGVTLFNQGTIQNNGAIFIYDEYGFEGNPAEGNQPQMLTNEIYLGESPNPPFGVGWSYAGGVFTIENGAEVVVRGETTERRLSVLTGNLITDITLENVSIKTGDSPLTLIEGATNVNLFLEGVNVLAATNGGQPGILLSERTMLRTQGNGSLHVSGGLSNSAGIGGVNGEAVAGSNVVINSVVVAHGAEVGIAAAFFSILFSGFLTTSSIVATGGDRTGGIIFEGDADGVMYGSTANINADVIFPQNLTVAAGQTLNIASGVTLTNEGVITNYGTINAPGATWIGPTPVQMDNGVFDGPQFAMTITNPGVGGTTSGHRTQGATVQIIAGDPIENHQFSHWTVNEGDISLADANAESTTFTMPGRAVRITANWELARHRVSFHLNEGEGDPPPFQEVLHGGFATAPADPTRTNFNFVGWFTADDGGVEWNFATDAVTEEIFLIARWTRIMHMLTVEDAGVGGTPNEERGQGSLIELNAGEIPENYIFVNWTSAQVTINNPTSPIYANFYMPDRAVTVTANWRLRQHNVDFDLGDGIGDAPRQTVDHGTAAERPAVDPTRSGFIFAGWFDAATGGAEWDFDTPITAPVTIFAQWTADGWGIGLARPDAAAFPVDFGVIAFGADAPVAQTVIVTNTGNQATGELIVTLVDATGFEFANVPIASIAPGEYRTFTVRPQSGLAVGVHDATVRISGGNDISAEFVVEFEVVRAAGPTAPPTVTGSVSGDGNNFTFTISPIAGAQYRMGGGDWQSDNAFTGIAPLSTHTFYARVAQTATHEAGAAGSVSVTFNLLPNENVPTLNFDITDGDFPKTITIAAVSGAEYRFNDGNWGGERTFVSAQAEDVAIFIRFAATATHNASNYATLTVNTANENQEPPPEFTLVFEAVDEATFTVTIPAFDGAEYSFDGVEWGSDNVLTGALPGETITGYRRMAARPGFNASGAVSDSVELPLFQVQMPTATPNGGTFTQSQQVMLATATAGATIFYTLDGTIPTADSTEFTGAFTIAATTTVRAIAMRDGMRDSEILTVSFTITTPTTPPITTPPPTTPPPTEPENGYEPEPTTPPVTRPPTAPPTTPPTTAPPTAPPDTVVIELPGGTITLDEGAREFLGDDAVIEISRPAEDMVLIEIEADGEEILEIGGTITVTIPWEDDRVIGVRFVENGQQIVVESSFDPETNTLSFETDRPGQFEIVPYLPFDDISAADWHHDYVAFAYLHNLMTGMGDGEFAPNMPTGRAMIVQVLFNMAGRPDVSGLANPFADISAESWYHDAVIWAAANGLISGFDGNFAPGDNITRAHLVLILNRYAEALGIALPANRPATAFADDSDIRNYAREAIDRFFQAMIITGYPDGSFNPDGEATRAELAAILQRFIEATQ
ncbi:MAG: S-layer homology domain-containing protein [Clostridiales bacterium]|nr:S-layer homology domain-containing protein [Clostridiales bacterium]